jgi:hypothetical protein
MEGNNLFDSISDDIIKVILIHNEINDLGKYKIIFNTDIFEMRVTPQ